MKGKFIIYKHIPPNKSKFVHIDKIHFDYRFTDPRDKVNAINFFSTKSPEKLFTNNNRILSRYEYCPEKFFKEEDYEVREKDLMTSGKYKYLYSTHCEIKKINDKFFTILIPKLKIKIIFIIFSKDICIINFTKERK